MPESRKLTLQCLCYLHALFYVLGRKCCENCMWYFVEINVLLDYVKSITGESIRYKAECRLCCYFLCVVQVLKLFVLFKFCEIICIVCRQLEKKWNSACLFFVDSLGCFFCIQSLFLKIIL